MTEKKRRITKKEAATDQLATSIKLYFENRDLLSSYTLAAAANGILEGIYENERSTILAKRRNKYEKSKNIRFSWKEEWEIRFKPEYLKEGFRLLNATQNFLKHADKDHNEIHEFNDWESTGSIIFMTVTNYCLVFGENTIAMNVFAIHYYILHPKILIKDNPLYGHIVGNALCENIDRRFSQAEIAAIGYSNLQESCPDLFPPAGVQDIF